MHLIKEFKKFIKELELTEIKLIKNFPLIQQSYNYDCGPTCIQMILKFNDIILSKTDIIKQINPDNIKEDGVHPKEIVNFLKKYNIKSKIRKNQTIEDLKHLIDDNKPVICVLQAYGSKMQNYKNNYDNGHYVILIGYDKNKLIFADPSSKDYVYLTYTQMNNRWHDKDKNNVYFDNTLIEIENLNSIKIKNMS